MSVNEWAKAAYLTITLIAASERLPEKWRAEIDVILLGAPDEIFADFGSDLTDLAMRIAAFKSGNQS